MSDDREMEKPAPTQYPILDVLAKRWSPIAYSGKPVEEDKLNRIFEAARWAPSSSNEQPWNFIVTYKGTDEFQQMAEFLVEGNAWAKNAPILALSVARTVFSSNGKPNRHALHDTGVAVGNLLAQATAEGLVVHQMAGYDAEKARIVLQLPEHHEPVTMMAIGYYGNHSSLSDKYREREEKPRQRKASSEYVFEGIWRKLPG
jgi:nitroreductase